MNDATSNNYGPIERFGFIRQQIRSIDRALCTSRLDTVQRRALVIDKNSLRRLVVSLEAQSLGMARP